ncbi:hypothetical protein GCM10023094_24230 [Rhodococcus olei]|uniref:Uncharacterized protein n=1 Tax=Rhodococcus olei TaxID=2161675 RepID=A0ABP8P0L0_9NOCA
MKIPLWIGGPAVIALSAVDAVLEIQLRAVQRLARTVTTGMGTEGALQMIEYTALDDEDRGPTRSTAHPATLDASS